MLTIQPSSFQKSIYSFIDKGSGNAVISATAGSGKTTTIVNALELIPKSSSVIFLAFNKSIVTELRKKVPSHVDVSTLHSVGFAALRHTYKRVNIEDRKVHNYLKISSQTWAELDDMEDEEKTLYIARVKRLIDLARVNLITDPMLLDEIADKHNVEVLNGESTKAIQSLIGLNKINREIDFTDMIYLPNVYNLKMPKTYDWVLVDECQDLNVAQQELIQMLMHRNSRFVAVGDPNQAIYGFAGADVDSFNNLKNQPNTVELPLSVCYRCSKKIVQLAQTIVPQITYSDTAPDGVVNYKGKNSDILQGDMVICRNTAPLVSLCLQFIAQQKKAYVLGGDIGKNLQTFIKRSKKRNTNDLFAFFDAEKNNLIRKIAKKKKLTYEEAIEEKQVLLFEEKVSVISVIAEQCNIKTCEALINKIDTIFSDANEGIVFSTIHKAKGLEADRVHIICADLMPSKYAKKSWEKLQETNLQYVAYTRAKTELIFNIEYNFH